MATTLLVAFGLGCSDGGGGSAGPRVALSVDTLSFAFVEAGAIPPTQTIELSNSGGGSLQWTAMSEQPWLTVNPPSGSTQTEPATLTIGVSPDGLTAAGSTYRGTILVENALASGTATAVSVALEIKVSTVQLVQVSADGGRVAWYTGTAGHDLVAFDRIVNSVTKDTEIYTMQPDGSDVLAVTGIETVVPVGFVGQPEWHPDGEHILFQAENMNSQHIRYNHLSWGINNDLWIINKDGTGAELIWSSPLHHAALHPQFNGDGTKLMFAERIATGEVFFPPDVTPGGENPWAGWQIHCADFDLEQTGTAKLSNHQILFGAGLAEDRGFFETHEFIDADTILFSRTMSGAPFVDDLFTAKMDQSDLTNLTNEPTQWEEHGLFSPSGNSLCFISSRVDPSWDSSTGSTAATLRTEIYRDQGGVITPLTDFNATGSSANRYLTSDYEWDRTGCRIVLQVVPVIDSTGVPLTPEIWMVLFPYPQ